MVLVNLWLGLLHYVRRGWVNLLSGLHLHDTHLSLKMFSLELCSLKLFSLQLQLQV